MGNYMSWTRQNTEEQLKKRKRNFSESQEHTETEETSHLDTPKRRRMKSTSKYIYETLFVNGENSDITIIALGKEWKLHKVYLCQSGYFSSMFNGSWKEANMSKIEMDIPDQNIDHNALEVSFGSLYRDDVFIKPAQVINILASAALLQLDGLMQQCADIMIETISVKTVCIYHNASLIYGQESVTKKCFSWLERNLMINQSVDLLRDISIPLMEKLVSSSDLFVMQVEMDVYSMLKKWMYVHAIQSPLSYNSILQESDAYFKDQVADSEGRCYLDSKAGQPYIRVFRCLRLFHIVNETASNKLLGQDKILPLEWLLPVYKSQWNYMLKQEQGDDKGPDGVTDDCFLSWSMRCARVLDRDGDYCWRWTGYNYGVDLLISYNNRLITFKRNTQSQKYIGSVSMQHSRSVMFRLTVASLDLYGNVVHLKTTGVSCEKLNKDEESVIMTVDRCATFPLHISVNVLFFSPDGPLPLPSLPTESLTASGFDDQDSGSDVSNLSSRIIEDHIDVGTMTDCQSMNDTCQDCSVDT